MRALRVSGTFVLVTAATLAAVALSGCIPGTISGASSTVDVITGERGLTANPYSPRLADRRVGRLLFRGLLVADPHGDPAPDLATEVPTVANGGIRDGGRTVVYRIRRGLKWHDGHPLTARDVAFTISASADGRITDDPAEDFSIVSGAVAVDDTTVRVSFSRPDSVLAWRLAPYVLPEHLLADRPDLMRDEYWNAPVGSGPYAVTAWDPDGTLELKPHGSRGPELRIRPFGVEADAMRAFNAASNAVWLDTASDPAGPSESLSTTWGPVWSRLIFNAGSGSQWADARLRHGFIAMATQTVPSDLPAWAYPYGVRPPVRTTPDLAAANAAFDEVGFRKDPAHLGARMRDGRRLDLYIGVDSIRPDVDKHYTAAANLWSTTGMNAAVVALTVPVRPTWTEGGSLTRGEKGAILLPIPAGWPVGWAFPYVSGDEPSWKRPWGLNLSRLDDAHIRSAYEAARRAPDPAAARARIAEAGRRVYELGLEVDIHPIPERILSKGVAGVTAWPSRTEALSQATGWKVIGSAAGGPSPAAAR